MSYQTSIVHMRRILNLMEAKSEFISPHHKFHVCGGDLSFNEWKVDIHGPRSLPWNIE